MSKYVKSILYVSSLLGAWYVMKLVVETKENPFFSMKIRGCGYFLWEPY